MKQTDNLSTNGPSGVEPDEVTRVEPEPILLMWCFPDEFIIYLDLDQAYTCVRNNV